MLDLVDAADRKLAMSIVNDAFMSNDILLVEDGALADGAELTNEPGAVLKLKPNAMGRVQRLGGLQSVANGAVTAEWFKAQIERASRSYDTNTGKEATRVTTASGLAMLRADAQTQQEIKKSDRNAGFERLYELLDWLALEFYDDSRLLFLGADPVRERPAEKLIFNADDYREDGDYWPRVDVTVSASDSVARSKAATLQALQTLAQSPVTPENWRLLAAELDVMDLPGKQDILRDWERRFGAETTETKGERTE